MGLPIVIITLVIISHVNIVPILMVMALQLLALLVINLWVSHLMWQLVVVEFLVRKARGHIPVLLKRYFMRPNSRKNKNAL